MNDSGWQELFDKLNNMSEEEFEKLIDELDKLPEPFCIEDKENNNEI